MRTIKSFGMFISESISPMYNGISHINENQIVPGIDLNPSGNLLGSSSPVKGKFYVSLDDDMTSLVGLDKSDPNKKVSINLFYGGEKEKGGVMLDKNSDAKYFSWMGVDNPLEREDEEMYLKNGKLEDLKNAEKATQLLGYFILRTGIFSNQEMMKSLFKTLYKLRLSYDQSKNNKAYNAFYTGIMNAANNDSKAFASLEPALKSELNKKGLMGEKFTKLWVEATKA